MFPATKTSHALAFVRDDEVWSVLAPAGPDGIELFELFLFHFHPNLDNSGFVGWLASTLKRALGTGVFVICGQNSGWGGIFDYWGIPMGVREEAVRVLSSLRGGT